MKVKIYVNTDELVVGEFFPRVLTEKQYQEKLQELINQNMENLVENDGFSNMLEERYANTELFFMEEEEKNEILEEFKPKVIESAKDEMEDYYEEFEIEI